MVNSMARPFRVVTGTRNIGPLVGAVRDVVGALHSAFDFGGADEPVVVDDTQPVARTSSTVRGDSAVFSSTTTAVPHEFFGHRAGFGNLCEANDPWDWRLY